MRGATEPFFLDATKYRQQRASMVLKNVDYIIEAHFELTDKAGPDDTEKHYNIVVRRLRKGQYHHTPYLGTREFPAKVELIENGEMPVSSLAARVTWVGCFTTWISAIRRTSSPVLQSRNARWCD